MRAIREYANRSFNNKTPQTGHTYRQLAVTQASGSDNFEFWLYEGDVLRAEPNFNASGLHAEVHFHPILQAAMDELERECKRAIEEGWNDPSA